MKPYINKDFPRNFNLTVDQAAELAGCSRVTIIRNTQLDPDDRYYIKGRQNRPGGPIVIKLTDFEDYERRIVIGTEYRGATKK